MAEKKVEDAKDDKKVEIRKRKTQDAWKKKKWYTIVAPKMFEEKQIGNTPADADKKVIGRMLLVPLYDFTGTVSHQFTKLILEINEIKGLTAHTRLVGFDTASDYIRRNIRRRRSMVRLIQTLKLKDGKSVRVTSHAFTHRKISTSRKNEIARRMAAVIAKAASEHDFETFIRKCSYGELSKEILYGIRTVCPVKRVEIGKCKEI